MELGRNDWVAPFKLTHYQTLRGLDNRRETIEQCPPLPPHAGQRRQRRAVVCRCVAADDRRASKVRVEKLSRPLSVYCAAI